MTGRVIPFPPHRFSSGGDRTVAARVLSIPIAERLAKATELRLEEPEILLALCDLIRDLIESSPVEAKQEAEFLHRFLKSLKRRVGVLDEHHYFLGESALLVGIACRMLALREEAVRWFDRADSSFRLTVSAVADWSRVSYHRLALCLEERRFEEFFEQLPGLADSFRRLGMNDEAVKCEILKGLAQMETGELDEAATTFRGTLEEADRLRNKRLVASSYVNLVHTYGMLGNSDEAMNCSQLAIPILRALNNRVALAQIQLGLGSLLRARGQLRQAVEAYSSSQAEFASIGMKADVAATSLMIADLLLDLRRDALAVKEILEALPVIDELKMVPEGMAALSLLRESVRLQSVNRKALRDLHGCFEALKS